MSSNPDEIRRQIQATRAGLSDDVTALSEKVSPTQIAKRQREKLLGSAQTLKDNVMGSADDAKTVAGQSMPAVGDAVSGAPGRVAEQTKGSPLAVGLVAFGTGLLLSSLFPPSRPEAQAAAAIKEQAEPLVSEVTSAAKEVAGNLQEPAQDALASVRSTATDAVDTVKGESTVAVGDVTDQAQDARDAVARASSS